MNLSGFSDKDNATFQLFDVNVTDRPQQNETDAIEMVKYVMNYVCIVLGVPGNILSAMIWLRRHVISKNSSALYLAVLAINDLLHLLVLLVPVDFADGSWLFYCITVLRVTTTSIEPLLVLSFSVERLIAISFPLQVRCVSLYHY